MTTKRHILVVDDDVSVVEILKTYLEFNGCRVTPAYGCRQALDFLRTKDRVDVMILDYQMPDGSGTDLLQMVGDDPGMQRPPVIMSSGVIDLHSFDWERLKNRLPSMAQALIRAYISKPYPLEKMDEALHDVLGDEYIPVHRKPAHSSI